MGVQYPHPVIIWVSNTRADPDSKHSPAVSELFRMETHAVRGSQDSEFEQGPRNTIQETTRENVVLQTIRQVRRKADDHPRHGKRSTMVLPMGPPLDTLSVKS